MVFMTHMHIIRSLETETASEESHDIVDKHVSYRDTDGTLIKHELKKAD